MIDNIRKHLEEYVDPGDVITDIICIAVTQRMDSLGQEMYILSTPTTGFITKRGMLEAALDDAKTPSYEYEDDTEEE